MTVWTMFWKTRGFKELNFRFFISFEVVLVTAQRQLTTVTESPHFKNALTTWLPIGLIRVNNITLTKRTF